MMKTLLTTTALLATIGIAHAQSDPAEETMETQTDAQAEAADSSGATAAGGTDDMSTASTKPQASGSESMPIIALDEWDYDTLYSTGWTYTRLIDDTEVLGENGEEIGDVENLLINNKGEILALIAEVGGVWDIGDRHISVPWDQVEMSGTMDTLTVPVTEENVDDFGIFSESNNDLITAATADEIQTVDDEVVAGANVIKASDIVGDYAFLTGGERYGYVDDLVFTDQGRLHAVVVNAATDYGGGYYAYPYVGYEAAWTAGGLGYMLPYGSEDITVIETFEYDRMASQADNNTDEESDDA